MTRIALMTTASMICLLGAQADVKTVFDRVDSDGDGYVSQGEFVTWQTEASGSTIAEATAKFAEVDADGSGTITLAEMAAAMNGNNEGETS